MTIERCSIDRTITFTCDSPRCNEFIETEQSGFQDARNVMKEEGWVSVAGQGDWDHYCPSCAEERQEKRGSILQDAAKKLMSGEF